MKEPSHKDGSFPILYLARAIRGNDPTKVTAQVGGDTIAAGLAGRSMADCFSEASAQFLY